jgi:3-hydroxyisobutyrate dehydrogenase-like beta-hydroxyacid dehydrogenase
MSVTTVGVLGLGLIGSIWARHLEADGLLGGVWNRTPQPEFPRWCAHPVEVLRRCEAIILCVSDPRAVWEVIDAAFPALGERHLLIQSSTIDPYHAARFEHVAKAVHARYVEAPFTGSKPAAERRETVFYLGGAPACVEAAESVLTPLSRERFRVGTVSQAATLKLAFNLQIAAQAQILCESLHFCRDAGITDETFFACLRPNVAWSGLTTLKEPKLKAGDYSPQFAVKHLAKDIRLAVGAAEENGMPLGEAVSSRLEEALALGMGEEDFIALYKLLGA